MYVDRELASLITAGMQIGRTQGGSRSSGPAVLVLAEQGECLPTSVYHGQELGSWSARAHATLENALGSQNVREAA